ncbi:MAG TPA: aconitase family protein, partial [Allosphingosinicella sp.]|nr:aconitase family protein [Allosphingosinicella sp.]
MTSTGQDSLGTRTALKVGDKTYAYYSLAKAGEALGDISRLPFSMKVLLENLLRFEDGRTVTRDDIQALVDWQTERKSTREIQYRPARVLMQDFTGVPAVVDLAAMRDAMAALGGDPQKINPLVPVHLVIDHSVMVDAFGTPQSFEENVALEYERNAERYQFLKWGQTAFRNFEVVPPGTGICHQVNLEYIARGVWSSPETGPGAEERRKASDRRSADRRQADAQVPFERRDPAADRREADRRAAEDAAEIAYPDTLVGTDSHTTMVNGLGVLGWGVGGIEAEAAMLGQPISMLLPQVIGFRLDGTLPEGSTATDLVLTVTEMLREKGVVSKFVEFFGPGLPSLTLADRATIGNMSPEFGSTCAIFPIDAETLRYLEFTGRPTEQIELVDAYTREQGLFHEPDSEDATYSDTLELDLADVVPSIAGPKRPQDRIPLTEAKPAFLEAMEEWDPEAGKQLGNMRDHAIDESFPASDPPAEDHDTEAGKPRQASASGDGTTKLKERTGDAITVELESGESVELDHGDVVIAAITSCTNTSNPSVMLAAGLVAKKAV